MPRHWAKDFLQLATSIGLNAEVLNRVNGWEETVTIAGLRYFARSVTYNSETHEYFVGVDPKKVSDTNSAALICGGVQDCLADVLIVPWTEFIAVLAAGEPVRTRKEGGYMQYKVHVRKTRDRWTMAAQRSGRGPGLDVSKWRYTPDEAVELLGHPRNS